MKRIYTLVSTRLENGGIAILLDGKPVKTPARNALLAPNEKLGNHVMQEWAGQGEKILPETMPLTQILSTKIDRVGHERKAMTENLLPYLDTDLLCYHTAEPLEIARAQRVAWDPWLDWFEDKYSVCLITTQELSALSQPPLAHQKLRAYVEALDDDRFTIFQLVTVISGSIVLAAAFTAGEATPQQVFDACHVEEYYKAKLYNEEKYGPDPLQHKKDKAALNDLSIAALYLQSLQSSRPPE